MTNDMNDVNHTERKPFTYNLALFSEQFLNVPNADGTMSTARSWVFGDKAIIFIQNHYHVSNFLDNQWKSIAFHSFHSKDTAIAAMNTLDWRRTSHHAIHNMTVDEFKQYILDIFENGVCHNHCQRLAEIDITNISRL